MADLVVGQIYPNDGTTPLTVQPGGIGGIVTSPAQTQGEQLGLFVFGCGHWFNSISVFSAEVGGQPSAILTCPVCGFIQRIVTPYSAIHTDAFMILQA